MIQPYRVTRKERFFIFYRLTYNEKTTELLQDQEFSLEDLSNDEKDVARRIVLLSDFMGFSATRKTFVWRKNAHCQLGKLLCIRTPSSPRYNDGSHKIQKALLELCNPRNSLLLNLLNVKRKEDIREWKKITGRLILQLVRRVDERLMSETNAIVDKILNLLLFLTK